MSKKVIYASEEKLYEIMEFIQEELSSENNYIVFTKEEVKDIQVQLEVLNYLLSKIK